MQFRINSSHFTNEKHNIINVTHRLFSSIYEKNKLGDFQIR